MATKRIDKYADYRYKIVTPEELREAKWLIEVEHDYKDMDDYIAAQTRIHKSIMREADAKKKKQATAKKRKLVATKERRKAA